MNYLHMLWWEDIDERQEYIGDEYAPDKKIGYKVLLGTLLKEKSHVCFYYRKEQCIKWWRKEDGYMIDERFCDVAIFWRLKWKVILHLYSCRYLNNLSSFEAVSLANWGLWLLMHYFFIFLSTHLFKVSSSIFSKLANGNCARIDLVVSLLNCSELGELNACLCCENHEDIRKLYFGKTSLNYAKYLRI